MPTRDSEKRPKGLRALSALKASGFKSIRPNSSDPPSPQDDDVDVPEYLTSDSIPPIPSDKQLPPRPPLPLNHVQRREVPTGTRPRKESLNAMPRNGFGVDAMGSGMNDGPMDAIGRANGAGMPTGAVVDGDYDEPVNHRMNMPMNGNAMPMARNDAPMPGDRISTSVPPQIQMPMYTAPRREPPSQSPPTPYDAQPPVGNPSPNEIPMNQVPRNSIQASTVPHAPRPIRPPSIPVVDRVPSDDGTLRHGDTEIQPQFDSTINTDLAPTPTDNEPTPTTSHENTPWGGFGPSPTAPQPEYEPVAAPLNNMHYDCYQEHRTMPVAQNVWYPVPCMTCLKHDQEIRHRCVFCCLRICVGCFQALQKCQRRSLGQLMESIQA